MVALVSDIYDFMRAFAMDCFLEFLTFIDIGRNKRILSQDSCDYGWLLSEFVGDSCVPGAIEPDHEINDSTDTGKLCRMCRSSTDQTSKYK